MAYTAVKVVREGGGVVLHAVVHFGSIGFEIGGDKPVGVALHFCGVRRDPVQDADEADDWQAEEKA